MKLRIITLLLFLIIFGCTGMQNVISLTGTTAESSSSETLNSFAAVPNVDSAVLSWINSSSSITETIQIRSSLTEAPSTVFEGTLEYLGTGSTTTVSSLTENTTSHYSIFSNNGSGNWVLIDSLSSKTLTYEAAMRTLLSDVRTYATGVTSTFKIISKDGLEISSDTGTSAGNIIASFSNAIDGHLSSSVNFSPTDNAVSGPNRANFATYHIKLSNLGKKVLVLDYATQLANINESNANATSNLFIPFQRPSTVTTLPSTPGPTTPIDVSAANISTLSDANNFVFLETTTTSLLSELAGSNYDIIIIDPLENDTSDINEFLNASQVTSLKTKNNLGSRLVYAYIDIGVASKLYYYWDSDWNTSPPSWLGSAIDSNTYQVKYWDSNWKNLLIGGNGTFIKYCLDAGFDGVVLGGLENVSAF